MGSRLLIARVVARLCLSYLAILAVVLIALDLAAYAYLARQQHDLLEPLLGAPEGRAVYAAAMRRIALGLGLLDVPLLIVAGAAAYLLARISVRPLVAAREREARFAAEAAHELRTPLARIASLAAGAHGGAPEARDAALERIAALAVEAAAGVGDLLALVRTERVAPQLAEPVALGALARAALTVPLRDGVRWELDASDDVWVVGDAHRLRRLVENLLENAGRHAAGLVRVRVRAHGDRAALSVEDDGPGVPAELRPRIFERLVRAREDGGGTGLGLAICRAIARAHGGDVVLEDRNRFVAQLPRLDLKEV